MSFKEYYRNQALNQTGGSFYSGDILYQRGYGIGSILSRLGRYVIPLAKRAVKVVGKQAIRTGRDFAADVIAGDDPGIAAKRNLKRGAEALLRRGDKRRRQTPSKIISTKKRRRKERKYVRV